MATSTSTTASTTVCSNCGTTCSLRDADSQIAELQNQVRLLTQKASNAVDKLADYEDELRRLKAQNEKRSPPTPPATAEAPVAAYSRFGASLFSRRPVPATVNSEPPPTLSAAASSSESRESDLQALLAKEQAAREKAEGKVMQMDREVEDLSVQLFQQANEMVASERKARAKLEERVEILEQRDVEKRKRLERLEGALKRIDRVRGLLAVPPG